MYGKPWIGVDLDGTLAVYDGWDGADHIGAPIQRMVDKVKARMDVGDVDIKIFTARVNGLFQVVTPERLAECTAAKKAIDKWCQEVFGRIFEVTAVKDYGCVEIWDDRAKQVANNTGVFLEEYL